jgi:glutaredoxin-like protein NrdH
MGMEGRVQIYTLSTCGHCKATKRFLDECNVEYEFEGVDILQGEERAAILEDIMK